MLIERSGWRRFQQHDRVVNLLIGISRANRFLEFFFAHLKSLSS